MAYRVDRILRVSSSNQWNFVSTSENPADDGTRLVNADHLRDCKWLSGLTTSLKGNIEISRSSLT